MRLIDADALLKQNPFTKIGGCLSEYNEGFLDCAEEAREAVKNAPTINRDGLRPQGRYRIDGHHIRFKCCNKVLSIVPNESDDYENLVSCPFCNAKIDEKENEDAFCSRGERRSGDV